MLNQVASKDKKKKDKKRKHARGGDTPAHEERSEEDKVKKSCTNRFWLNGL